MKRRSVNTKSCSYRELCQLVLACGFTIREGGKHAKVLDAAGVFVTTIPRHERLDPHTAKEIVKKLVARGCDVDYA